MLQCTYGRDVWTKRQKEKNTDEGCIGASPHSGQGAKEGRRLTSIDEIQDICSAMMLIYVDAELENVNKILHKANLSTQILPKEKKILACTVLSYDLSQLNNPGSFKIVGSLVLHAISFPNCHHLM